MKGRNIQENIENIIIDLVADGSDDRLIAFRPKEDTSLVDFIVKKKGDYDQSEAVKTVGSLFQKRNSFSTAIKSRSKELSFQANIYVGPGKKDILIKDFLHKDFVAGKNFYLMFIYFNKVYQDVSNIWIIPSFDFQEIINSKEFKNNKAMLRLDEYAKFLIDKRELGKVLLDVIEAKDDADFFKFGSEDKKIDLDKLKEFISEARANTFALDLKPVENSRLSGSKEREYLKSDYSYQDIYFTGLEIFIGQEIVYYKNMPAWVMSYLGEVIEKEALVFLKDTLIKLQQECRFEKSCEFEKKEFKYIGEGQGIFEKFSGKEQVFQRNKNVYSLTYQGGLILK